MPVLLILAVAAGFIYLAYQESQQDQSGGPDVLTDLGSAIEDIGYQTGLIMPSNQVTLFAQAIAAAEGFGQQGAIPTSAHNPGDLTMGDFGDTGNYVVSRGGEKIIVFPDDASGWNALYRKLENIVNGGSHVYNLNITIAQMGALWAGSQFWAKNVAAALGVSVETPLSNVLS